MSDGVSYGMYLDLKKRVTALETRDRRFTAAVAAMQGLLAADRHGYWSQEAVAAEAVETADALLAVLAKGGGGK